MVVEETHKEVDGGTQDNANQDNDDHGLASCSHLCLHIFRRNLDGIILYLADLDINGLDIIFQRQNLLVVCIAGIFRGEGKIIQIIDFVTDGGLGIVQFCKQDALEI